MALIDVHVQYGTWPGPTRIRTVADFDQLLERFTIEHACVASIEAARNNLLEGNRRLFESLRERGRIHGYVTCNPNYDEASVGELKKYAGSPACCGVVLHPGICGHALDSPATLEILNACRRYGKPILISDFSPADIDSVAATARQFNTLKFLLSPKSGIPWGPLLHAVEQSLNISLIPSVSDADRDSIRRIVDFVGPRRVLFGSRVGMINPAFVAGMIKDADIADGDRERILVRNARELFQFS